jgi:hypothetical protein
MHQQVRIGRFLLIVVPIVAAAHRALADELNVARVLQERLGAMAADQSARMSDFQTYAFPNRNARPIAREPEARWGDEPHTDPGQIRSGQGRVESSESRQMVSRRNHLALVFEDDGNTHGPKLGDGYIGLRQMAHSRRVSYTHFKVRKVEPKQ